MRNQIVLRHAMTAKAAFYAINCTFLCVFSGDFAALFGAGNSHLVFGMGLVFFNLSALTVIALLQGSIDSTASKALIAADILIICALFGSLAMQVLPFNVNGYIFTSMMAAMVSGMAYAEHYGLKYEIERDLEYLHELEVVKSDAA